VKIRKAFHRIGKRLLVDLRVAGPASPPERH
jgi:hypothetical protein